MMKIIDSAVDIYRAMPRSLKWFFNIITSLLGIFSVLNVEQLLTKYQMDKIFIKGVSYIPYKYFDFIASIFYLLLGSFLTIIFIHVATYRKSRAKELNNALLVIKRDKIDESFSHQDMDGLDYWQSFGYTLADLTLILFLSGEMTDGNIKVYCDAAGLKWREIISRGNIVVIQLQNMPVAGRISLSIVPNKLIHDGRRQQLFNWYDADILAPPNSGK